MTHDEELQLSVTNALHANPLIDPRDLRLVVTASSGEFGCSSEEEVVRAAWATPGVSKVDNFLEVGV